MKKIYIVLIIVFTITLVGCNNKNEKNWNDVTEKFQELEKKKQETIKVINEKSSPKTNPDNGYKSSTDKDSIKG